MNLRRSAAGIVAAAIWLTLPVSAFGGPMSTPGDLTITPSGAASYTIPIDTPPGTAGMEPKLALNYNSQGGNGWMGIGWTLTGLSIIHRCQRTVDQDAMRGGVNFDADDRFCLDGQRLMLVAGSAYGADGAEYRTEIDSFSKVVSYGVSGSGPQSFKVWTKAGEIIEYGNTSDSRMDVPGSQTIRVWAMNRVSDRQTNYLTVAYVKNLSDYHASSISYTGNANAGKAPDTTINIDIENRPDAFYLYQAGARFGAARRVNRIRTTVGSALVKEYRIAYGASPASTLSRVESVTECAQPVVGPVQCRPPTTFIWNSPSLSSARFPEVGNTDICANDSTSYGRCDGSDNHYTIKYPDINGDGRSDVCFRSNAGIRCMLSNGNSWDTANPIETTICANGSLAHGVCNDSDNFDTISYADMNADGLADLVYRGDEGIQIWYSTGAGFANQYSSTVCANDSLLYGGCGNDTNYKSIRLADINADGRTDVCLRSNQGVRCFISTGTGLLLVPVTSDVCANNSNLHGVCNDPDNYDTISYVDFNGDGRADLAYRGDEGMQFWFTKQAPNGVISFELAQSTNVCANASISPSSCNSSDNFTTIRYTDINGDAIPDMCYRSDDGIRCYRSSGKGLDLANPLITDICANGSSNYGGCNSGGNFESISFFGDLNGDGRSDLMYRGDQGIQLWYSTGLSFTNWQSTTICANGSTANGQCNDGDNYRTIDLADVNGDGLGDLVYRSDAGIRHWFASGAGADLILEIVDGLGHSTSIFHKPLPWLGMHTRDTTAVYPVTDLQFALWVVYWAVAADGIGGSLTTEYKYGGLKAQQRGRGSLGFRWMEEFQVQTNLRVRTEYRQDFPYVGLPSSVVKTYSDSGTDKTLSTTSSTYACRNPASGAACTISAGQRYFPYASSSVDTSTDLNGSAFPTVSSSTQYDNFGNATQSITTTSDGYGKTVSNSYANNVADWILGRLTSATVTTTSP